MTRLQVGESWTVAGGEDDGVMGDAGSIKSRVSSLESQLSSPRGGEEEEKRRGGEEDRGRKRSVSFPFFFLSFFNQNFKTP